MSSSDNYGWTLTKEQLALVIHECLRSLGHPDGRWNDVTDRDLHRRYDPTNLHPHLRPSLTHSLSDVGCSMPRIALPTTNASSSAKPSEAEVAFQLNQMTYIFMSHFDNKAFELLTDLMTTNVNVPKAEYNPIWSADHRTHLGGSEESSKNYVKNLKSAHSPENKFIDTNHHIGASYVRHISSSERLVHCQTKIVQRRYNNGNNGDTPRSRVVSSGTAMMEVILHFKLEKDKWKIAGMAGSIKWIKFDHRSKGIISTSAERDPERKKIVENTLRYHRILPSQPTSRSPSRQRFPNQTPSYHGARSSFNRSLAVVPRCGPPGFPRQRDDYNDYEFY